MDWIDENIAIGDWIDALRPERLGRSGVEVVIDVRPLFERGNGGLSRVPRVDRLLHVADMLVEMSKRNAKVIIRCRQGKDRTPLVATAYVSRRYGMPLKEAYQLVKKKRPRTVYHWDWLKMLEKS
ncbi:MAG: dual specificity protein phosphatase [Methanomassiliicoccales archaeon]|jgi:hypothetical protein